MLESTGHFWAGVIQICGLIAVIILLTYCCSQHVKDPWLEENPNLDHP